MREISVVINTYNRRASLEATLCALRQQEHERFEVVVVNGPSTDGTDELLAQWSDVVRAVPCPEVHLGKSRNLGIDAAAGELVAFIDDDAIPEPDWLTVLDAAFDDPEVAGAGGLVIDHTGTDLQYLYSAADRLGRTYFDIAPPFDRWQVPYGRQFLYLQGTNTCFRRDLLAQIGGFDEEIEYFLDETEVCMQLADKGWKLVPLTAGAVHHKYLASQVRTAARIFTRPYAPVKNRVYFALQHGREDHGLIEALRVVTDYAHELRGVAAAMHAQGTFDDATRDGFLDGITTGFEVGLERGLRGSRQSHQIAPRRGEDFRPFSTIIARDRMRICFVSEEYPPGNVGGIGRYTFDLARGLAARGHDVHVVARTPDVARVDHEDGVWVHRLAPPPPGTVDVDHVLAANLAHCANVYHAVRAIHDRRGLDLVIAPIWNSEGLLCLFDDDMRTVTTLMTTLQKVVSLMPSWETQPHPVALAALEDVTLAHSAEIHAISHAIWRDCAPRAPGARVHVAELGVEDVAAAAPIATERSPEQRILFVGRLEVRKGVPTLFDAAIDVLAAHPHAEVRLAGADTPNTEHELTYRELLAQRLTHRPDLLRRFRFLGYVPDDVLAQEYAQASVLCVPSLFESFGLVVLEGMRAGLPVVASRVGGMAEILDGDHGILVPPGDARALADALDTLLGDDTMRARIGAAARAEFERFWRIDHAVARVEALARDVVAGAASGGRGLKANELAAALAPILRDCTADAVEQIADPTPYGARRILDRIHGTPSKAAR